MRAAGGTFLLALALGPAVTSGSDFDAIQKRGTLRVLAVADDPEDEFMTREPGIGLERELLEAFAKLHGLRLELVPLLTWDGLVPALLADKGDLIAGRYTVTDAHGRSRSTSRPRCSPPGTWSSPASPTAW